jgi:uncharacterized protein involved in exopolysaccharide biosynthesis
MELRNYLDFLWRYRLSLLGALVLGSLLGGSYAATRDETFQAVQSLYVQRQPDNSTTQYFTYEGYYAQQVAASYTDTALKLLTSDEILRRAAENAGMATDVRSLSRLRSAIVGKKDAPQLIKVTTTLESEQNATRFSHGLAEALKSRTAELNRTGDSRLTIDSVNSQEYVSTVKPPLPIYAIAGAILGFLSMLCGLALYHYIRDRH